jgi:hypothetical protein
MTKTSKLWKKRRFRGNKYVKGTSSVCSEGIRPTSITDDSQTLDPSKNQGLNSPDPGPSFESRPTPPSASSRKIGTVPNTFDNFSTVNNNIILSIDILSQALLCATACKKCKLENSLTLTEDENSRQGLACKLLIECKNCFHSFSFWTSHKTESYFDINLKCVYGLRAIGKGSASSKPLFALLDLPKPPLRFERYNDLMVESVRTVAHSSMIKAVEEAVEINVSDDGTTSRDLSIGIDGTWQRRGFSSLNGVVSVSSFDTSKILDVEILTKYCHTCSTTKARGKKVGHHFCDKNFEGSSGSMEVAGAKNVFSRSVATRNVRYKYYLGDGDCKGFSSVVESKPYGSTFNIEKLECVGHVQKRMGGRLRKLRKDLKGQKLSDGLKIGGKKGRLTDSVIDSLQNYYGLAIRRNKNDLEKMKKDVWATLFHKASTDDNPQHQLCDEVWCKYKQATKENKTYKHNNSLDKVIIDVIKPVFRDLANTKLLEKCLHGRTQNINESFNSVVWSRIPKNNFVGLQTLRFGTFDSVITFNEGNKGRLEVLKELGVKVGRNCAKFLSEIDHYRMIKSDIACEEKTKLTRKRKRMIRKKLLDAEKENEQDYAAGMF